VFAQDSQLAPPPAMTAPGRNDGSARGADARAAAVRLPGLDALRAIAALCVVVMHTSAIWPGAPRTMGPAYLAVDFFFLLSGFVMARTYEGRMSAGAIGAGAFMTLRYRRLWPTMAIGAAASLPFLYRDVSEPARFLGAALPNLLLLPTFVTKELFSLNTPAWSIFFELAANLVHVLVLHRLGQRALGAIVAVFGAAVAACAFHFGNLDLGSQSVNMVGGFARVGFSYGLGVLLWRAHRDRAPIRVPRVLALIAMPLLFAGITAWQREGWRFDLGFVLIGGPLLLWGGLRLARDAGARAQGLCMAAGALSFPLYAVHYPVLLGAEAAGLARGWGPVAAVAAAALVAWVTGGLGHLRGIVRVR